MFNFFTLFRNKSREQINDSAYDLAETPLIQEMIVEDELPTSKNLESDKGSSSQSHPKPEDYALQQQIDQAKIGQITNELHKFSDDQKPATQPEGIQSNNISHLTAETRENVKPVEISVHKTYPTNLFWAVSQMARDDEKADKRYTAYWKEKHGINQEEEQLLKTFHENFMAICRSGEDFSALNALVYDERLDTVDKLVTKLTQNYDTKGVHLGETLRYFDKLYQSEYTNATTEDHADEQIKAAVEDPQFTKLIEQFRSFMGPYATEQTPQKIFLMQAPPISGSGTSEAIKPGVVIHSLRPDGAIKSEAGIIVHEIAHNQFQPFKGILHQELTHRGINPGDFNEGVVYALHYGIIEGKMYGNKDKLANAVNENRGNKSQVAFAAELLPIMKEYFAANRTIDNEFLDKAQELYHIINSSNRKT